MAWTYLTVAAVPLRRVRSRSGPLTRCGPGSKRVKPSVWFRPIAKPISNREPPVHPHAMSREECDASDFIFV